jgi:SulP family sulfate permease
MLKDDHKKVDAVWLPKSVVCLRYYNQFRFRSDMRASLILTPQIFPVSIAIAMASGLHPFYGISCAAMAGLMGSGLGESKVRISAPNVVFVTVASNIVSTHGVLGLALSTSLAGIFLIFLALTGLAAAVQLIPRAIVAGLSSGVAVLVFSSLVSTGAVAIFHGASLAPPSAAIMSTATLILILLCRRVSALIPASLIAVSIGAFLVKSHHLAVQTVGSSYGVIRWPFHPFPTELVRLGFLGGLLGPAFAIAVLSAFQSLDAMDLASNLTGERYSSKVELSIQGIANIGCSLFAGLPTSGSCLHTSTNWRGGAQTPLAGVLLTVFLLALYFLTVPLVSFIPLPVISGILLANVCMMSHWREIPRVVLLSRSDACAWLATALLTITTDLLTAIAVGMFIGMFLHIRRRRFQHFSF